MADSDISVQISRAKFQRLKNADLLRAGVRIPSTSLDALRITLHEHSREIEPRHSTPSITYTSALIPCSIAGCLYRAEILCLCESSSAKSLWKTASAGTKMLSKLIASSASHDTCPQTSGHRIEVLSTRDAHENARYMCDGCKDTLTAKVKWWKCDPHGNILTETSHG